MMSSNKGFILVTAVLTVSLLIGISLEKPGRFDWQGERQHLYETLYTQTMTPEVPPQHEKPERRQPIEPPKLPAAAYQVLPHSGLVLDDPKHPRRSKVPVLERLFEVNTVEIFQEPNPPAKMPSRIGAIGSWENLRILVPDQPMEALLVYDQNGSFLYQLGQVGDGLNQYWHKGKALARLDGNYLLLNDEDRPVSKFLLYRLGQTEAQLERVFSIKDIVSFLVTDDPAMQPHHDDAHLRFGDFHFEYRNGELKLWLTQTHTINNRPRFQHIYATASPGAFHTPLNAVRGFGESTIAERMKPALYFYRSVKVGDQIWAMREFDPQIDIFDAEGFLLNTLPLAPMKPNIFGSRQVTDSPSMEAAIMNMDGASDQTVNDRLFSGGLFLCGDYILALRINPRRTYSNSIQIFTKEGVSVLGHVLQDQFLFFDAGGDLHGTVDLFDRDETGSLSIPVEGIPGLSGFIDHEHFNSTAALLAMQVQLNPNWFPPLN